MKKVFKIIGIVFASVVLLLICLLAYLKFVFDPNQFKAQIIDYVQEKKQRTLAINGDIQLTIFPQLGVDLSKVSLSAHQSTEPFASLEKASVSLALIPLLKKQLLVDQMRFDGVQLLYTRDAKGQSNLDDLLSQDSNQNINQNTENNSNQMRFDVKGIVINNADVTIHDAQNNFHAQAKNLQLTSGRLADKTATNIELSTQLISSKPQANVQINLASKLYFDLQAQEIKLDQFNFSLKGILENKKVENIIKANTLQANRGEKTFSLDVNALEIKGQTQLGDDLAQLSVNVPSLQVSDNRAVGKTISGDMKLMGKNNLKADFTIANVSGTASNIQLEQVAFNAQLKQGDRSEQTIKATLQSALNIDMTAERIDMPRFNLTLHVNDPSLAQKDITLPINGEVNVNLKTKTLRSDFQGQVDDSKLKATLTIFGFDQPAFAFTTDIDQLNLDRYLGDTSNSKKPNKVADPTFNFSALKTLNANGKISIGALQIQGIKLNALQLPIRANKGKIELADFSAQLYQGTMKGSASLNANNNSVTLQHTMNNININPLMQDAISKDVVEGRGDIVMNVQTQGNNMSEFKQALNGKISLNLVDGAVKGINLAKSLRDFKNKFLAKSDQTQTANMTEKTDFSAMSASILFSKGIGQSDDLHLQSPFLRVGGAGNINLHKDSLDYIAKVTVVNTSTGQAGKELAQLKDLTIPIRLYGPFDKIDYQIQFSQISSEAIKSIIKEKTAPIIDEKKKELEEKKNEVEEKLKNQLKDKLKGIFK